MRQERPSITARKVALNIISLGAKPEVAEVLPPEIVDTTARLVVAAGVVGQRAVRFARSRWAVAIYEAFDWMLPGQYEAFAHRKAFCERQARDGLESGATQVLALGAGYDTLGWRLADEHPDVSFFEIDHPATGRLKAKGVEALGPKANLHLIQEDLGRRRLVDLLAAVEPWDPAARSVILLEGLTMYLPPAAVRDVFAQCGEVVSPGSRVVFTHVGTGHDGRPDAGRWTGLVLWMLRSSGEPWLWSIQPEQLPRFLADAGWTHAPELAGETTRKGVEYFAVARKPSTPTAAVTACA